MRSSRIAVAIFFAGLALRGYSIVYLGRFFTVDVTVAADQRVVDTGPYRHVRHPSYAGILAEFLGVGLTFGNWAALVAVTVPTLLAFLWRIRIEEDALERILGEPYRSYVSRTKRLIPAVY